jgi:hypothetical protein
MMLALIKIPVGLVAFGAKTEIAVGSSIAFSFAEFCESRRGWRLRRRAEIIHRIPPGFCGRHGPLGG